MDIVTFRKYKSTYNKMFICNTIFIFITYMMLTFLETWNLIFFSITVTFIMLTKVSISLLKANIYAKISGEYGFSSLYPTILKGKEDLILTLIVVIIIAISVLYIVIVTTIGPIGEAVSSTVLNIFLAIYLFLIHEMFYMMGVTGGGLAIVSKWKYSGNWEDYYEMCIERGLEP